MAAVQIEAEPAVQCLAISPTFAEDRLVLAGTEADGLLRSDDAGSTWARPPALLGHGVAAVAYSTRYASNYAIAAATELGVAISTDEGRTWQMTGQPPGLVLSLVFVASGHGEVLLAGLHQQGIARSDDRGVTWELSLAGLSARLLTSLVLSPAFARDRTLFIAGPHEGVSRSEDGGRTRAPSNTGLDDTAVLGLALSPAYAQDRTLYAATETGVHVSHDGAVTWALAATEYREPTRLVATEPAPSESASPVVLAACADGRLLASDTDASSWRPLAAGFDGAEILLMAVSPAYARDRTILVATSKLGLGESADVALWRSVDGGTRWDRWFIERGVRLAAASGGQPFTALAVSPTYAQDELVFVSLGPRILKPLKHAREVRAGARRPVWRAAELGPGALAVTAVTPSPIYAADTTVFATTNAGVFVSRDGGDTFHHWSDGLSPSAIVALAVSPSFGDDRLVCGLGRGGTIWLRHDAQPHSADSG